MSTSHRAVATTDDVVDDRLLDVVDVSVRYGKLTAVHGASLHIDTGEAVGVVGHNGAGKTTLLNAIFGLLRPSKGTISYKGDVRAGRQAHASIKAGMALVPAEQFVFASLTVRENLQIAHSNTDDATAAWATERGRALFPVVWDRLDQPAGSMSGGERRMLSVAMALAWKPDLLILDEPSLGLAPALAERVFDALRELARSDGVSILCVEQSLPHLLRLVDRVYNVREGQIVREYAASELTARDEYWDLF